ncbi:HTH_Tnp_Tc3_2 domain-containing protein [Trichonephila clavipes]|uniref:HTH_Tnp_Tc3_2 domain-containing protein n=1 Tax=Trichonephila clavipes TaxID=2585209 RepID=A0A8X6T1W7_TRICX|nr:HTH_Tnp_Tc3_2 domain-containing protein [Trichonephila clavipes]
MDENTFGDSIGCHFKQPWIRERKCVMRRRHLKIKKMLFESIGAHYIREGRESIEDKPRSGRPSVSKTAENVIRVRDLVRSDRRLTVTPDEIQEIEFRGARWPSNRPAASNPPPKICSMEVVTRHNRKMYWCTTHGPFNFRNHQTAWIFKVDSGKSIPRIHGWWTKNYKEQLALTVRDERLLRRIVRSQRSQTLAQITTQLNDGAIRTISKQTVQRLFHHMGYGSRRPKRIPLLNALHRAARLSWAREDRDWSVEDWK